MLFCRCIGLLASRVPPCDLRLYEEVMQETKAMLPSVFAVQGSSSQQKDVEQAIWDAEHFPEFAKHNCLTTIVGNLQANGKGLKPALKHIPVETHETASSCTNKVILFGVVRDISDVGFLSKPRSSFEAAQPVVEILVKTEPKEPAIPVRCFVTKEEVPPVGSMVLIQGILRSVEYARENVVLKDSVVEVGGQHSKMGFIKQIK